MNHREMNRRELIRSLVTLTAGGVVAPLAGMPSVFAAPAECPRIELERTVVNVMLQGGADLRFLFMPKPGVLSAEHETLFWKARRNIYSAYRTDKVRGEE